MTSHDNQQNQQTLATYWYILVYYTRRILGRIHQHTAFQSGKPQPTNSKPRLAVFLYKEQTYNCQHIWRLGALLPNSLLLKKSRVGWNFSDACASTSCSWSWYDYDTIQGIFICIWMHLNNSWMKNAIHMTSYDSHHRRGTSNGSRWNIRKPEHVWSWGPWWPTVLPVRLPLIDGVLQLVSHNCPWPGLSTSSIGFFRISIGHHPRSGSPGVWNAPRALGTWHSPDPGFTGFIYPRLYSRIWLVCYLNSQCHPRISMPH